MIRTVADLFHSRRKNLNYDGLSVRDQVDVSGDLPVRSVVVERVDADSPAAKAGVRSGDVLDRIGEFKIQTSIDVERAFLEQRPGAPLPVLVRRDDREQRVEIALAGAERSIARPDSTAPDVVWHKLGLQLAPVVGESVGRVNRQLNGGLEVMNVQGDSVAAKAGIRKGDILVGLHQWETLTVDNVHYVLTHPELATFSPLSFYILRQGQVRRGYLESLR